MRARELPVSQDLAWLLNLYETSEQPPAPDAAKPAAALVLIRDTRHGLEVFLTRQSNARGISERNRWGFPTTSLVAADVLRLPLSRWNYAKCGRTLRMDNTTRALQYFVAAGRVALASTGVLLAEDVDGRVLNDAEAGVAAGARGSLLSGQASFPAVLEDRDLRFRPDLLQPWMRWINVPWQLRRFDTIFFVAAVPHGQRVDFQSPNESWGGWMRPAEVFDHIDPESADDMSASTRLIIESLLSVPTVGAAMARVRDIEPIRPEIVKRGHDWRVLLADRRDPSDRGQVRKHETIVPDADDGEEDTRGLVSQGDDSGLLSTDDE